MTTEPILMLLTLAVPPERAYEAFVAGFGNWWPVDTHSLSRLPQTSCAIEARVGGRVYEIAPDGVEHAWGAVERLEVGRLLRFTWHPGREKESAQWIELRFAANGEGAAIVSLRHGGWEALGEIAPMLRAEYVPGWQHVFKERYAAYVLALRH